MDTMRPSQYSFSRTSRRSRSHALSFSGTGGGSPPAAVFFTKADKDEDDALAASACSCAERCDNGTLGFSPGPAILMFSCWPRK